MIQPSGGEVNQPQGLITFALYLPLVRGLLQATGLSAAQWVLVRAVVDEAWLEELKASRR
jgi:hypothetical protein